MIRGELCDRAVFLARGVASLLPYEPEAAGLLALLLTDARRAAHRRSRRPRAAGGSGSAAGGTEHDRRGRGDPGGRAPPGPARTLPAAPGDRRLPLLYRGQRRGDRLAADRVALRRADPLRADPGGGGQPGRSPWPWPMDRPWGWSSSTPWPITRNCDGGPSCTSPGPSCSGASRRDGDATGAYRSALELERAPASRSFIAGAQPAPRAYSTLAATSRAADPASTTGQILNQTTGVRAPVSAVSAPSAISSPAATR